MPNRLLKESICTSDSIDCLSWFEEVLFYRLIVNCDDYGRFDGRAAIIKNRLFPLKENLTASSVEKAISQLANAGLVTLYMFEGKPYLYLPTWAEHQNVRAKKSKYPAPDESMNTSANICMQMNSDACNSSRNPIQSNPIRNPNPTREAEDARAREDASSADDDPDLSETVSAFQDAFGDLLSRSAMQEIVYTWFPHFGKSVLLYALDVSKDNGKLSWAYIRAVLMRWKQDGLTTVAEIQSEAQAREKSKNVAGGKETVTGKMRSLGSLKAEDFAKFDALDISKI